MTPTKQKKATQITTQMWDKLLQAARDYAGLFDYRAAAIRIGKNEGWTESELVEVGVIEQLSEVEQEKFNRRYKQFPMLSASPIRETPRNDPNAQIIEHVPPRELEPWETGRRTPTLEEERAFNEKNQKPTVEPEPNPPTRKTEHVFTNGPPKITAAKYGGMFVVYRNDDWTSEHNTWPEALAAARKLAAHEEAKQKAAPESGSLERGQEEPKGKGSGKEPSGATD